MNTQLVAGKEVRLKSWTGEIVRTVVQVLDGIVLVCTREEYQRAKREAREPLAIGFRLGDIVS